MEEAAAEEGMLIYVERSVHMVGAHRKNDFVHNHVYNELAAAADGRIGFRSDLIVTEANF